MIYLDASVLVSLCCSDANSTAAAALAQQANDTLLITTLGELEAVNAFGLRTFRREMSARDAAIALGNLEADIQAGLYQQRPVPQSAISRARNLSLRMTAKVGIRSVDLLHIAAALELEAKTFYTFDRKQHSTAQAAGLQVNALP